MTDTEQPDEMLPTGLASLDAHVEGQGLRPETLLAVRTPPHSVGRRFAFNLCADRPVHYVALGHDPIQYVEHIRTVTGLDGGALSTGSIPLSDPADALADHLEAVGDDLPPETTVLVDPLTPVSAESPAAVAQVFETLRSVLRRTGGLGVLLAVAGSDTERGRWSALSRADAVFSVIHETTQDSVSHHVAIDRLPMGQRLREEGKARTFEIPPHLEMTLDTSKTLSP